MLSLTLVAQASTLPICLPVFAVLPCVSPLANIIVAPLISLALAVGMLALCLGPLSSLAASALLDASAALAGLAGEAAIQLARLPFASTPATAEMIPAAAIAIVAAGVLYIAWPRPFDKRILAGMAAGAAVIAVCVIVLPALRPGQLVVMDVGQGDALLVREGAHAVLIDTGPSETALLHSLARAGVRDLDAVVITHLDNDHYGALSALRGTVAVRQVLFAASLPEAQSTHQALAKARQLVGEGRVGELRLGDRIVVGRHLSMEVVWPDASVAAGGNSESLCMLLAYDDDGDGAAEALALLAGDAEYEQLAGMLAGGLLSSCDIYKVGHHGSKKAIKAGQAADMGIRVALFSVGAGNRYGHPTDEALDALLSAGAAVYRTDIHGDLTVSFQGRAAKVRYANMVCIE
jgi:competence protein ComEC